MKKTRSCLLVDSHRTSSLAVSWFPSSAASCWYLLYIDSVISGCSSEMSWCSPKSLVRLNRHGCLPHGPGFILPQSVPGAKDHTRKKNKKKNCDTTIRLVLFFFFFRLLDGPFGEIGPLQQSGSWFPTINLRLSVTRAPFVPLPMPSKT